MSLSARSIRRLARAALAMALLAGGSPLARAADPVPVPNVVIYPGDIIREGMLSEQDLPPDFAGRRTVVLDRSVLIGRTARRTLLPGLPVSMNSIGEAKIVTVGAMVRVVFVEGGLEIATYASALQAGAAGDVIPVRNMESGLTISGTIQGDGTIRVNKG